MFFFISEQIFNNLRKIASEFTVIYRVWMGYTSAVNLLIPEDIEVNHPTKPIYYFFF